MAMFCSVIIPFFAPMMHERYFLLANVMGIIFAFYYPRFFFIPVILMLSSCFSYFPYLFGKDSPIALPYLSLVTLGVIALLIRHLLDEYLYDHGDPISFQ
jgi:hypothetical protein